MTEIGAAWRSAGEGTAVRVQYLRDGHRCGVRFIWRKSAEVLQHSLRDIRGSFDTTRHFVRFGARIL